MDNKNTDIYGLILDIIRSNPGITDDSLRIELSNKVQIEDNLRIEYIRGLNSKGFLKIKQNDEQKVIYTYQDPDIAKMMNRLDKEEKLVYETIEKSGNQGMTKREIKSRLGLIKTVSNSALKKLEKFALVKTFKAKNKTTNVYILSNLDPDVNLVGGELYHNGKLDKKLIEQLTSKIQQLVASSEGVSKHDIKSFLMNSVESARHLKDQDIDKLVNTLILDDKIEDVSTFGMSKYVQSRNKRAFKTQIVQDLPCLSCPVSKECGIGYKISPENCVYFDEW